MSVIRAPRNQRGYSLIEAGVVVGVLGVLTFAVTAGMENIQHFREQRTAMAQAESARNAVRAFAMRNKRLPCPAGASSVREPVGPCTQATGWLPYETLGLAPPPASMRLKYGVYISGTANLAAPKAVSTEDMDGGGAFIVALGKAAAAGAGTGQPYYVQELPQDNAASCGGTTLVNPAFLVIAPASDLGGTGAFFESPHREFGVSGRCVTSPARHLDSSVDDVVVAESITTLLGWMSNASR